MARPKDSNARQPWTKNRAAVYRSLPPMPPPTETRPVTFCVPDHPDWRAALYGAISLMGSWLAWQRDDAHTGKEVAAVWNEIITQAQLAAERGEPSECMDYCQIIADCISGGGPAADAITNHITNLFSDPDFLDEVASNMGLPGYPMSDAVASTNLIGPCGDTDVLFGQIRGLVDELHNRNQALFSLMEVATNAIESASILVDQIPIFGAAAGVLDYADKLREDVVENYNSQFTTTLNGYRDQLSCAILCKALENCRLSWDDLIDLFEARLSASIALDAIAEGLVIFLLAGSVTGSRVADFSMYQQLLALRAINQYGKTYHIKDFALIVKINADNPDPDWALLDDCDCVEVPTDPECFDFGESAWGWMAQPGGYGVRDSIGLGPQYYAGDGLWYFWWTFTNTSLLETYDQVELLFSEPITDFELLGQGGYMIRHTGAAVSSITATAATKQSTATFPFSHAVAWNMRTLGTHTAPSSFRVVGICKRIHEDG